MIVFLAIALTLLFLVLLYGLMLYRQYKELSPSIEELRTWSRALDKAKSQGGEQDQQGAGGQGQEIVDGVEKTLRGRMNQWTKLQK